MPAYIVEIPQSVQGVTLPDGARAFPVFAGSAADAKALVASRFAGDANALLQSAQVTATEIAAGADFADWTATVRVFDTAGAIVADVTITSVATDDMDDIGGDLVTALNATASIANASYNSTTNVLTVASGGGGDDLGDHTVECEIKPPAASFDDPVAIPGLVGTITHEGSGTDALTVALAADAYAVPAFYGSFKS